MHHCKLDNHSNSITVRLMCNYPFPLMKFPIAAIRVESKVSRSNDNHPTCVVMLKCHDESDRARRGKGRMMHVNFTAQKGCE